MSKDRYLQTHSLEISGMSNDLNLSSENDINISTINALDIQSSDINIYSSNDIDMDAVNNFTITCDTFDLNASQINFNGSGALAADPSIGFSYTSEIEIVVMNSAMEGGWTVSAEPGNSGTVVGHFGSDGFSIRNKSGGNLSNLVASRPLNIGFGPNATYKLKRLQVTIDSGSVPDTDLRLQVVECPISGTSTTAILELNGSSSTGSDTADYTMDFDNYAYFARIFYDGTISNNSITPAVTRFKVTISKSHVE